MASIDFSNIFYEDVFDNYRSICEAFENAKTKVEKKHGKFEAKKLKILHAHQDGECPLREKLMKEGKMKRVGAKETFKILPNKISNAI